MLKKKVIITKVVALISLIALLILPVSAEYQTVQYESLHSMFSSESLLLLSSPIASKTYTVQDSMYFGFGFDVKKDYTYTLSYTYHYSGGNFNFNRLSSVYVYNQVMSNETNKSFYLDSSHINDKIMFTARQEGDTVYVKLSLSGNMVDITGILYFYFGIYQSTVNAQVTIGNQVLTCTYDPGGAQYEQDLVDTIASMQQQDSEFQSNALEVLDSIKNEQENTNQKLDNLPGQIGDELQKESEREKQEASSDGDKTVKAAQDALGGIINVASLKDAVAPLVSACGYTGTTSVWSLPAIKLPAISGVMDEVQLNEPINFDLSKYVTEFIPENILKLVQYLLTAALIIFAVKEIISTVNEVLGNG